MTTEPTPPMMTTHEAADRLNVSTKTIRNYVARGLLPAYRIGSPRTMRFERADVEAMRKPIPVVDGAA